MMCTLSMPHFIKVTMIPVNGNRKTLLKFITILQSTNLSRNPQPHHTIRLSALFLSYFPEHFTRIVNKFMTYDHFPITGS